MSQEGEGLPFTPSLFPSYGESLLRLDLTPEALSQGGWFILRYLDGKLWTAVRQNSSGGSRYAPPFPTVEEVSHYVYWLYIRKVPLAQHPKRGEEDGHNL